MVLKVWSLVGGWVAVNAVLRMADRSQQAKNHFFQSNQYKGFYQLHIRYIRLPLQRDFLGKYQHAIFQFSF